MKYQLSTILFEMGPCDTARIWIETHMDFDTLTEAIKACPDSTWLWWVLMSTEMPNDAFSEGLPCEMWEKIKRFRRDLGPESHAAVVKLFLSPEYLDRFAYALIQYAKWKGIEPS